MIELIVWTLVAFVAGFLLGVLAVSIVSTNKTVED